jgi:5-hydroxyisourate hydrolase
MKRISTHVLDIVLGTPAKDVPVRLERQDGSGWRLLAATKTDQDGGCAQLLLESEALLPGTYRLSFDTAAYFNAHEVQGLYPMVEIAFQVRGDNQSFHIPLLLSPNGYTTYRGS